MILQKYMKLEELKMKNLKNKRIGRPKYIADEELLKKLYIKIKNKELTNAKAWQIAGCR